MPFLFRPRVGPFIYTPGKRKTHTERTREIRANHAAIRDNLDSAAHARQHRTHILAATPRWKRNLYRATVAAWLLFAVLLAAGLLLG